MLVFSCEIVNQKCQNQRNRRTLLEQKKKKRYRSLPLGLQHQHQQQRYLDCVSNRHDHILTFVQHRADARSRSRPTLHGSSDSRKSPNTRGVRGRLYFIYFNFNSTRDIECQSRGYETR